MTDQTSDTTAAQPEPVAQSPDAPSPAAAVARGIANWYSAHVRNSPISRHAPSLQHLGEHLTDLREAILKEL